VNAGVLALSYGMLSVHELTAILDVAYAAGRREVTPIEQYVHGLQGRVPMADDDVADASALGLVALDRQCPAPAGPPNRVAHPTRRSRSCGLEECGFSRSAFARRLGSFTVTKAHGSPPRPTAYTYRTSMRVERRTFCAGNRRAA
jgi:hypothetical protein